MSALRLSSWQLSLLAAVYITAANNRLFFATLNERLDIASPQGFGFVLLIILALIGFLSIVFLVFGTRLLLKPVIVTFILLSSLLGYFTQQLGVVFDPEMMRNIAETVRDQNRQEAFELLSYPMIVYISMFGVLPAAIVLFVKVSYKNFAAEMFSRLVFSGCVVALLTAMIVLNFRWGSYFSIENRDLRLYITPHYAVASLQKYIMDSRADRSRHFEIIGTDAVQNKSSPLRTVGILVVGETARADHFSLNGYERTTNPLLQREHVISLKNVSSCGTTTAISVPCMFSLRGREDYRPNAANMESNVLDVLHYAGVKVIWIDANSSCKSVCDRIESINLLESPEASTPNYRAGNHYDEALLSNLEKHINSTKSDILIVLHTLGSHGPAYYRRYPKRFAVFQPECRDNSPQSCTHDDVENAYDNTIVYTDFVLDKMIKLLKNQQYPSESFLFYVSDHGESLGEGGVYLHGLPYYIAPKSQTNVPMIIWFSDEYSVRHGIDAGNIASMANTNFSHDNISHTLLGFFNVNTDSYIESLDIFPRSRRLIAKRQGNSKINTLSQVRSESARHASPASHSCVAQCEPGKRLESPRTTML